MKEFHDFFQTHEITPHIKNVMTNLTHIVEIRQSVDNFSIDFNKMFFEFYSQINAQLLKELENDWNYQYELENFKPNLFVSFNLQKH